MSYSFVVVEDKIFETHFFLEKLSDSDFAVINYYFSAFLSAARSVTFALQACMAGVKGFNEWYKNAQKQLKSDKLAPFFKELRNDVVHKGINPINTVPFEIVSVFLKNQFRQGFSQDHFLLIKISDDEYSQIDVLMAAEEYMKSLITIVYDCYSNFLSIIDPRWYFTEENFGQLGKTIEDALEELGYPRTWFDGMPHGDKAWKVLRRNEPFCPLNPLFNRFLGKTIPDPNEKS
jgi:hypothetical protein